MKTRQEKIDAIYEKIARKDLSFGCKFGSKKEISWGHITFEEGFKFTLIKSKKEEKILYANKYFGGPLSFTNFEFENLKIIRHPVMLGDILDWIENYYLGFAKNKTQLNSLEMSIFIAKTRDFNPSYIFEKWEQKRFPIEEQSDECVDFVYDLIFK